MRLKIDMTFKILIFFLVESSNLFAPNRKYPPVAALITQHAGNYRNVFLVLSANVRWL